VSLEIQKGYAFEKARTRNNRSRNMLTQEKKVKYCQYGLL